MGLTSASGARALDRLCDRDDVDCSPIWDLTLWGLGLFALLTLVAMVVACWRWHKARRAAGDARLWLDIHKRSQARSDADPGYRRSHVEQVARGVAICHVVFRQMGLCRAVAAGDKGSLLHIGATAGVIGLPGVVDLMNRAVGLVDARQAGRQVTPSVSLLEAEFAQMGGLAMFSAAANAHIRAELAQPSSDMAAALTQT
jgi:hypothetical protein